MLRKAGIVALILVGLAPNVGRSDYIQAQPIYARNNTSRPIWVAAHYIPAGSSSFVTGGWFKVDPGCCKLILYNNGRNIYFGAHNDQGVEWNGTDTTTVVDGQTVKMFHRDTGPCYDPWTVTFNP
jgi:hypothetical protein